MPIVGSEEVFAICPVTKARFHDINSHPTTLDVAEGWAIQRTMETLAPLFDDLDRLGVEHRLVFRQHPTGQVLGNTLLHRHYNIRIPRPGMLTVVS